jgi:hypothetical protein
MIKDKGKRLAQNLAQKLAQKWKLLAIVLGSLVFLLLIFSLVPIKRVSYAVEEMYSVTETYYVQETYTVEEPYTVLEPYTDIEISCAEEPCQQYIPIDYLIISEEGWNHPGGKGCNVEVYIQNNDVIGGTFTVEFQLTLLWEAPATVTKSKYIEAGDTERIVISYEGAPLETPHSYTYSITSPTKLNPTYTEVEVTKYRSIIEYGEVTKEIYVPQEVEVLKTRTVIDYKRVSLFDYLINY